MDRHVEPVSNKPGDIWRSWLGAAWAGAIAAGLSLLALFPWGCTRSASHPDIVLVTVDTLRADHVGLYGYPRATTPRIDERFAAAAIYERAYSTEASTPPSVASILTGLLPQEHRVRLFFQLLDEAVPVVTELLPDAYQSAAFVSNMVLTDEAMGLASRFDFFDDFVDEKESYRQVYERSAGRTTDAVLAWLDDGRDPQRPLFLWVHYIDPHGPYHPPDHWKRGFEHEGSRPIPIDRVPAYQREPGVTDGLSYVDFYDEEIAYLDSELGRLLDEYEKRRSLEQALVVFTADHGESMMEHERWFTHGYQVYDEIVRVPLMIKGPGVVGGRHDAPVSLLDIAPTLLRFAGVEPTAAMGGVDLRSVDSATLGSRVVYAEATEETTSQILLFHRRAAIRGSLKFVLEVSVPTEKITRLWSYDLATDPDELDPQPWPEPNPAGEALLELTKLDPDPAGIPAEYSHGIRIGAPKVAPRAGSKTMERLKALGYAQ